MSVVAYNINLLGGGISGSGYNFSNPSGSYIVTYSTGSGVFFPVLSGSPVTFPSLDVYYYGRFNWAVTVPSQSYCDITFRVTADNSYITASEEYQFLDVCVGFSREATVTSAICCTPSITSIVPTNITTSSLYINYSTGSGSCCLSCSIITLTTSSNGISWGGAVTAECFESQFTVTAPAPVTTRYYRIQQTCSGSVTSSFSATGSFSNTYVESCVCYSFFNETGTSSDVTYTPCGGAETVESIGAGQNIRRCVNDDAPAPSSPSVTITPCTSTVVCTVDADCTGCA
jgi:hypothetical protein